GTKVWFEITTLLIPGENDSRAEIEAESDWLIGHLGPDVPLHFTAFHPDWKMMDHRPTPPETLRMAGQIARSVGHHYVYTGNIHDPRGQSTFCHDCSMTSPSGICLRTVAASLAALPVMASLRRARGAGVCAVCRSSCARQTYNRRNASKTQHNV